MTYQMKHKGIYHKKRIHIKNITME